MAQKTILEEIIDDFMSSLKDNSLFNEKMLEKLAIIREDRPLSNTELHSIISFEDEK